MHRFAALRVDASDSDWRAMVLRALRRTQNARRSRRATQSSGFWSGRRSRYRSRYWSAAGLLARSLYELSRVDPGFEPARVLSFRMSGNYAEFGDYPRLLKRIDTALEQLRALPGVEAAATSFSAPGVPTAFQVGFELVEDARRRRGTPRGRKPRRVAGILRDVANPAARGRHCAADRPRGAGES